VEPTVCTTLPKVEKADTSPAEVPMAQALVTQLGSKSLDGNPTNDDPDLLNFTVVEFWIASRMSSRLQMCWLDSGKSD
jgi:hypothetical protein